MEESKLNNGNGDNQQDNSHEGDSWAPGEDSIPTFLEWFRGQEGGKDLKLEATMDEINRNIQNLFDPAALQKIIESIGELYNHDPAAAAKAASEVAGVVGGMADRVSFLVSDAAKGAETETKLEESAKPQSGEKESAGERKPSPKHPGRMAGHPIVKDVRRSLEIARKESPKWDDLQREVYAARGSGSPPYAEIYDKWRERISSKISSGSPNWSEKDLETLDNILYNKDKKIFNL